MGAKRDGDEVERGRTRRDDRRDGSGGATGRLRSVTLTLHPPDDAIHPIDRVLAEHPDVTREALYYVDAFVDGGVLLYRLSGTPNALEEMLTERSDVLAHEVVEGSDATRFLYLHVASGEPAGTLAALVSEHGLLVDAPLTFTASGGLRVTLLGLQSALRAAIERLPPEVSYVVERVGPFSDDPDGVLAGLTDRQREVLETAVSVGYYDVPKRGDRERVAAALGLSPSTVGKHLQKAERHVITRLVGGTR